MQEFVPGQRWLNDLQPSMGLGRIIKADFRQVTVNFDAADETFVYARESAPLTRIQFAQGDHIVTHDGQEIEVVSATEQNGLTIYTGKDKSGISHTINETLLGNFIRLDRPRERLFTRQIDPDIWFDLRCWTHEIETWIAGNPLNGLIGGRVNLIPHQLYIASTVANRYAPRVLLADEVGLGKTIEAGMIIHQQLITERVGRVLIVVPDALVHQWLVEMLRRFNLRFKIFNKEKYSSLLDGVNNSSEKSTDQINPFLTEQLVLCSLGFLCTSSDALQHCQDAGWELMVVDEAHHLEWQEDGPGWEYQVVEVLAKSAAGLLLLTATPEQLGKSGHYARLRLLDPERFHDFSIFEQEEKQYQPIAGLVQILLEGKSLTPSVIRKLESYAGMQMVSKLFEERNSGSDGKKISALRIVLAEKLLDRHGTGRVLFRNTRSAITGFPERRVLSYPLPLPAEYKKLLIQFKDTGNLNTRLLLCPELLLQDSDNSLKRNWTDFDPRVGKLLEIMSKVRPAKVLVIAASATTAQILSAFLMNRCGINTAVFHEHMTLMERDKAAAWFADPTSGVQVMVCSEIGSEGRNFQFVRDLVLFDLPLNPDLLEQRIGRLDRIGQKHTIHIHVPFLQESAQQVMFDWYHTGLDAFQNTCESGLSVYRQVLPELIGVLYGCSMEDFHVVENSLRLRKQCAKQLKQGRDRLLEFNSCRSGVASELFNQAIKQDQEARLKHYMELAFDCFGIEFDVKSEACFTLNTGEYMLAQFKNLPEDGMTVTYDRNTALAFEDIEYLTWDHPLVREIMELVQAGEMGNTSVTTISISGVRRGTLILETLFILESASSRTIQSNRYLSPTLIRVMIDQDAQRLDHRHIRSGLQGGRREKLAPEIVRKLLHIKQKVLRRMLTFSEKFAEAQAAVEIEKARDQSSDMLKKEIQRLEELFEINPNVRQEEIDYYRQQLDIINIKLDSSTLRLDGVRVIIAV